LFKTINNDLLLKKTFFDEKELLNKRCDYLNDKINLKTDENCNKFELASKAINKVDTKLQN